MIAAIVARPQRGLTRGGKTSTASAPLGRRRRDAPFRRRRESNPRPRKRRQNFYKRSPHSASRPPAGVRTTYGRASHPLVVAPQAIGSPFGAEPVSWRRCPGHGPSQERHVA